MITNQALQSLAAKLQTTELNLRREYFQHLFLSYFYQQPGTDQIYFKGGQHCGSSTTAHVFQRIWTSVLPLGIFLLLKKPSWVH